MTFLESAIQLCALLWASPARCISPPALYGAFLLGVALSWQHCVCIMQSDLLSSIPRLSPLLPACLLCSWWHAFAWEFLFAWVWEERILLGCSESAGFVRVLPRGSIGTGRTVRPLTRTHDLLQGRRCDRTLVHTVILAGFLLVLVDTSLGWLVLQW